MVYVQFQPPIFYPDEFVQSRVFQQFFFLVQVWRKCYTPFEFRLKVEGGRKAVSCIFHFHSGALFIRMMKAGCHFEFSWKWPGLIRCDVNITIIGRIRQDSSVISSKRLIVMSLLRENVP